ncbi:MAG: transposase, partial [Bacteroidales bacterium]|nr:transposase [Bacteroidales bacterium]
ELYAYTSTTLKSIDCQSIVIGGVSDHIHILFVMSRTKSISDVIKHVKKETSKWLKTKSSDYGLILSKFSWQAGYGIFSVSASQKSKVINYIRNQQEHHKTVSFMDEVRVFYKKHEIEYDERYVWS